jgi:hypothetical protein
MSHVVERSLTQVIRAESALGTWVSEQTQNEAAASDAASELATAAAASATERAKCLLLGRRGAGSRQR